jgi:multidrug efflux system membrane fusion protein
MSRRVGWSRRATVVAIVAAMGAAAPVRAEDPAGTLASVAVRSAGAQREIGFDGTVEAVRQTVVAAQVAGAVVDLGVKAGDLVRAGQPLMRLDARAAEQAAAASTAGVAAIRAELDVAARELERQRQLFREEYISRAALERAEARFNATKAQLDAQTAQAGAARTQSGLHRVVAPYAGVVAEVPVALGDMAMPGRPLATLYDPGALRVTVSVPQSVGARGLMPDSVRIELPGVPDARALAPVRVTALPTVDAATHTVPLRLDLPPGVAGVAPGQFARVTLRGAAPAGARTERLYVPARAVVRRAELTGVYVLDRNGRPLLRQVRLGPVAGDEVEVLAGVAAGDRVATDPQAAARVR